MSDMFNELNIEVAQRYESNHISRQVERATKLCAPQTSPNFDGLHCIMCDEEIPKKRLDMGRIRCVDCQSQIES